MLHTESQQPAAAAASSSSSLGIGTQWDLAGNLIVPSIFQDENKQLKDAVLELQKFGGQMANEKIAAEKKAEQIKEAKEKEIVKLIKERDKDISSMSERLAALTTASDANAAANTQLQQQLEIRLKHVEDKEFRADRKMKEVDKTSEEYIKRAETEWDKIEQYERNLKERENQIQLQETEIKYGLEQLQLRLTGQQGIQLNPMQSSSSMSVPQYQMQIPYGEQSYGEVAAIGRVKRLSVGGKSSASASAPAPQYGMTGGQSSSSMGVPQLQIQTPPAQFALTDLIEEEQLSQEIKAEAEKAAKDENTYYQYPIVKPKEKELDDGEFKQQLEPKWKKESVAVLRKQLLLRKVWPRNNLFYLRRFNKPDLLKWILEDPTHKPP